MSAQLTDAVHGIGPSSTEGWPRPLADRYGRVATDLRVSLTDRCNLRCTYCMPEEGLEWMAREEMLSPEELLRLLRIAVSMLGVKTVRLTGGEPLLRSDLAQIVSDVSALEPRPTVALTTNGIGLARRAESLAEAGLGRINVSLDTLDPQTFKTLTRRNRLEDVLAGIDAAVAAGLKPVKINTVLMRGVNDHEAVALVDWAMAHGAQLRFIEQMPLDAQHGWSRDQMITAEDIHRSLGEKFHLVPRPHSARGSAPAELFGIDGTEHEVGIIAAVTKPFCGDCDRVRLTADGQLRNCLFARHESDLREGLRGGASDAELAEQWLLVMAVKLPGHGINDPSFLQPARPMSAIGG